MKYFYLEKRMLDNTRLHRRWYFEKFRFLIRGLLIRFPKQFAELVSQMLPLLFPRMDQWIPENSVWSLIPFDNQILLKNMFFHYRSAIRRWTMRDSCFLVKSVCNPHCGDKTYLKTNRLIIQRNICCGSRILRKSSFGNKGQRKEKEQEMFFHKYFCFVIAAIIYKIDWLLHTLVTIRSVYSRKQDYGQFQKLSFFRHEDTKTRR